MGRRSLLVVRTRASKMRSSNSSASLPNLRTLQGRPLTPSASRPVGSSSATKFSTVVFLISAFALPRGCSHIENLMKGVQFGFLYKMRSVYAHFPININVQEEGKHVQIRNFLGEKIIREVRMREGVICKPSGNKDEIIVEGNDIEL